MVQPFAFTNTSHGTVTEIDRPFEIRLFKVVSDGQSVVSELRLLFESLHLYTDSP